LGHDANEFVADAHVADLLLMQHRDELHAVPRARADVERQLCNDPSRRLFRVTWSAASETRVARGREAVELLSAALDRGALGAAAQLLGVGQQLVDLAVRYATQREQFGRPIGSFQAVKHMLANVAVRLEFARPVVYRAAASVAQWRRDARRRRVPRQGGRGRGRGAGRPRRPAGARGHGLHVGSRPAHLDEARLGPCAGVGAARRGTGSGSPVSSWTGATDG
jgi:alkylation response protein AidB-like acyl-CoA dehydrogenase